MRYKPDWKRRKEVTVLRKGERLPGEDRQEKHMEKPTVTVLRKGERLPGEDRQEKHMEKPTENSNTITRKRVSTAWRKRLAIESREEEKKRRNKDEKQTDGEDGKKVRNEDEKQMDGEEEKKVRNKDEKQTDGEEGKKTRSGMSGLKPSPGTTPEMP
ncbi:hypothetical protein NDU88_003744 [Pleurodeles waltl]|uniref:Uncharacterized protein n=1 Tax=Pleurodeles waltl TaxID=8319 RepID=A0AAV7V1I5_PLEWA|nr:hypothetical protein NDU88_003744 [Pleurodeles waltl]